MSLIGTGSPVGRPSGTGKEKGADASKLTLMRQRFEHVCSVESENRENYIKNVRISSSNDQWDAEVKKRRGNNRPALTFNLLNGVVKQIIGDYRQNKLAIKILPSGGEATEEVAEILAGIIRSIELDSHADHAYTNALECSARGGFGYFRVRAVYEADDVFNQKLIIEPVYNPLTVYFDPSAKRITREDAMWCIVTEMIDKDTFRREYPKAEENGWDLVDVNADNMDDWGDDEQIRVAEYYTKEIVSERLVAFDNGSVIAIENDAEIEALKSIGWNPVKERQADRINIHWCKCTGSVILESRVFKTRYIPIIPVLGEEVNLEGKTLLRSSVFYGIDAQHSYNYERSTAVERSALAAKAPWLVTQKQIEMWRAQWDNANNTPQPYLVHTPDQAMPQGPQRIEPPSASQADASNAQMAAQDVQRTTLVFNSQLGAQSNIQSGVGLSEQQSQGATSTFIFPDNLRTGIEYCGRVLIDAIPFFYDRERVVRTINTEDAIEMTTVNQQKENPLLGITEVLNDITVGKYDVVVTAGKAFASRRREAVDGMMKFAQAFPQQAPMIADLMIENMDVPEGEIMAARIKRSLPPQIVNDPDSPEGQQAAQQAQQQQAQQQQMQQQMLQQHMQTEQGKQQAEMAKSQASVIKSQAEVVKAKADTIAAVSEVHKSKTEAIMNMMDQDRIGSDPQTAQSMQQTAPQPAAPMQIHVMKSAQDDQREQELHHGLGAIAQHLAAKHDEDTSHAAVTHELLAHLVHGQQAMADGMAHGHQAIAQQMERQNQIAAAPVKAIRDKTGRITGSQKDIK